MTTLMFFVGVVIFLFCFNDLCNKLARIAAALESLKK
jgi:hypothetical protein